MIFETLAVNTNVAIDIDIDHVKIFRKHLSELIKRKQSSNKYATRVENGVVRVYRLQ
jgi:hypothetical protein